MSKISGMSIDVGCGEACSESFVGCDIRPLLGVRVVCSAWEVSQHFEAAPLIYSRHMLEHLTYHEAMMTLYDWYKALIPGGRLHIIVPDMDFHCLQWIGSAWTDADWSEPTSNASHSAHSFYGWQRETETGELWDVHKSGFGKGLLALFLRRAGFVDIDCRTDGGYHLNGTAKKPLLED